MAVITNVGFIGSGTLTQALAHHLVAAHIPVLIKATARARTACARWWLNWVVARTRQPWSRRPKPTW